MRTSQALVRTQRVAEMVRQSAGRLSQTVASDSPQTDTTPKWCTRATVVSSNLRGRGPVSLKAGVKSPDAVAVSDDVLAQ